jgi:hypothetical protein
MKLSPSLHHKYLRHKVEYLYEAVVGASWAMSSLSASPSSTPTWTFQQLYSSLDASWLQEQEEVEARQRDKGEGVKIDTVSKGNIPGIVYQGLGKYGRPRQAGSRSSIPDQRQSQVSRSACEVGKN